MRSMRGEGIRKKDNPDELSLLVEQVMELSNHVIDGYVKIVDFAKYFLCGLREFQNLAEMLLYGRFYSVIPLVDGAVW